MLLFISALFLFFGSTFGFQIQTFSLVQSSSRCPLPSHLMMAEKKGFGAPAPKKSGKKKQANAETSKPEFDEESMLFADAEDRARATLREMEAKEEEKRQAQIAKIRALQEEERAIQEQPDAGVIPEVVSNRMLGRIIPFIALPVLMGLGLFYFFIVLARQYDISVEPSAVAYATQAPFAVGLLGITYGVMSASWDPEIEGSALGIKEFKINLQRIFDGLERTKDRQVLKDQIRSSEALNTAANREQRRMAKKNPEMFEEELE